MRGMEASACVWGCGVVRVWGVGLGVRVMGFAVCVVSALCVVLFACVRMCVRFRRLKQTRIFKTLKCPAPRNVIYRRPDIQEPS